MASPINANNVQQFVAQTDHKGIYQQDLIADLKAFLGRNGACACSIVQLNINNSGLKKVFQVRGKLKVTLPQSGKDKMLGFKYILP